MLATDKEWKKWGEKDPYFGVVSHPQFRSRSIAQNRDDFFRSGEEFIAEVLSQADRYFGGTRQHESALDFGCGVARLTIPLARRFKHVDGVDVSAFMLDEARKNCKTFAVDNAEFHLTDGKNDYAHWPRRYDFVNSYIVLQHIPLRRGYAIIDSLLGLLADAGIAMLHVSLRRKLPPIRAAAYQIRHNVPLAGYVLNLLQRKPLLAPQMQMNEYDLARILEIFSRHNMKEISITSENHQGVATARLMARKHGS
jgi:SAM-dependent methyltransferase